MCTCTCILLLRISSISSYKNGSLHTVNVVIKTLQPWQKYFMQNFKHQLFLVFPIPRSGVFHQNLYTMIVIWCFFHFPHRQGCAPEVNVVFGTSFKKILSHQHWRLIRSVSSNNIYRGLICRVPVHYTMHVCIRPLQTSFSTNELTMS